MNQMVYVGKKLSNKGKIIGPSDYDRACGARVRALRQQRGLSMTAVAQAVGITYQQIQKIEKGINRLAASRAVEIAAILKCRPIELMPAASIEDDVSQLGLALDGLSKQEIQVYTLFLSMPDNDFKTSIFELVRSMAENAG